MLQLDLGGRLVGDGQPAFIIAEAGINHQGDETIAMRLVDIAADAGADAVKFQKRTVSRILTREGLDMPYDNRNSFGATYGEHKRALELSLESFARLKRHAESKRLTFLASAWDEESVDALDSLGVVAHKLASADLTNMPLLEHTARTGKPLLVSTGMSSLDEVDQAIGLLTSFHSRIILLQCTSTYPSEFHQINLRVLHTYRERYGLLVGYSGHEKGIVVPPAAVALGACVVERHFTIDRTMRGSDHAASLEPHGLIKLVRDIRAVEAALGDGVKRIQDEEWPIRRKLAKSVVSTVDIPADTVITREMLTTKGPGTGIPASQLRALVGARTARSIPADQVLRPEDIQPIRR